MKYSEFKEVLAGVTTGDKTLPSDNVLYVFIDRAIRATALETKPLVLVSDDIRDDILFMIEDEYFIRTPKKITTVDDVLDIDEDLILAVAYFTASLFVHRDNKKKYKDNFDFEVSSYNWARYYTTLNMCKECSDD